MFVPAFGLAAALISPVNIDDKPRTWADFGIPDFRRTIPSLVKYNGHYAKLGTVPTTENHYNINGLRIIEEIADGTVRRVIIIRPGSDRQEIYLLSYDGVKKVF